jgi:glycosyltransferase involved in cell wall biosynthesis
MDSIHTDVPRYTRVFTADIIKRLVGDNWFSRLLLERFQIAQKAGDAKERNLEEYWRHCDSVIVSHQSDYEHVAKVLPKGKIHRLRRGIDFERFNPDLCDRKKLESDYGVPKDKTLLLYVGRLDAAKHVMTVARTIRVLVDHGQPVHGLFVGRGVCADEIRELLGEDATLPGVIPQEQLGFIYASADLLVFSSETETYGNVVVEAKASGTAVAVSNLGGPSQLIGNEGDDGIIIAGQDPQTWVEAIAQLIDQPNRLRQMGDQARQHIESEWPSWKQVLEEDLIPIWKAAARQHGWKEG